MGKKKSIFDKEIIKKYLTIILGVALTALGISVFYTPNRIVNGGVSGVATIFFHTFRIPTGLTFFIINAILLITEVRVIGKKFVLDTIFGSLLLSVFLQTFSYLPPLADDVFLATVFGSVLYGFGIGLTGERNNRIPKKILDIDEGAFVIFSESQQILGNGFKIYK